MNRTDTSNFLCTCNYIIQKKQRINVITTIKYNNNSFRLTYRNGYSFSKYFEDVFQFDDDCVHLSDFESEKDKPNASHSASDYECYATHQYETAFINQYWEASTSTKTQCGSYQQLLALHSKQSYVMYTCCL